MRASTTIRVRSGWTTLFIFLSSSIRFLFVCILPAVSMRTASMPLALACWTASKPTAAASEPYLCFITFTPSLLACSSSCSIAPALYVSLEARTTLYPWSMRSLATLAIVVVFPVPFIPTNNMTYGFPCLLLSPTSFRRSMSPSVFITASTASLRASLTRPVLSPKRAACSPVSLSLSSEHTLSATSTDTSLDMSCSWRSQRTGSSSFSESSLLEILSTTPRRPFLSFSNTWGFPSELC